MNVFRTLGTVTGKIVNTVVAVPKKAGGALNELKEGFLEARKGETICPEKQTTQEEKKDDATPSGPACPSV